MLGSDILEVILGLAILCVGLAMVSSILMESASLLLNRRGAFLHNEIRELLKDDGLTKEFYRHPLVSSLYSGGYKEFSSFNLPPYIPARIFALALIDIAAAGGVVSGSSWVALGVTGVTAAPYPYGSYPPSSPYPIPPNPALRFNIEQNSVMNAEIRRVLLTLVAAAADDPVRSRENIEEWFEAAMASAADQYRRATLMLVMVISIALAASINADALAMARNLATGKSVRSALIALTTRNSDRSPSTQTPPSNTSDRNAPYSATSPTSGNQSQTTPSSDATPSDIFARVLNDRSDMQALTLTERLYQTAPPLGWDQPPQPGPRFWLVKIAGILLTGLAVSMIAPLWFGLWKRFTTKPQAHSRLHLADLEFIRSEFESIGGTHRVPPGT